MTQKFSLRIIIFLSALLVLFCFTGCNGVLLKKNDFKLVEEDLEWGVMKVKLIGTESKVDDDNSIQGSPYNLVVSFLQNEEDMSSCSIQLDIVSLVNKDNEKTILSNKSMKSNFDWSNITNTNFATFMFENLDMDYVQHHLMVAFELSENCSVREKKGSKVVILEKDYHEEKITFWDVLLGV